MSRSAELLADDGYVVHDHDAALGGTVLVAFFAGCEDYGQLVGLGGVGGIKGEGGDTVAFSETVMVGTRAESRSETESELTLNVMLSPLMTGCDVTMLLASTEVSKVNETISASDDNSSACLQENVPAMATVAASRRCFNDKLLRMSSFWFE